VRVRFTVANGHRTSQQDRIAFRQLKICPPAKLGHNRDGKKGLLQVKRRQALDLIDRIHVWTERGTPNSRQVRVVQEKTRSGVTGTSV
jgi:hypothetical protein